MSELVAPQMPPFYSPGESFLRGFALMANINQKRQQEQLAIQKMVSQQALAEQTFGLKQQMASQTAQNNADKLDLASKTLDLKRQQDQLDTQDGNQTATDLKSMADDIKNLTSAPGSAQRLQDLEDMKTKYPLAAGSVQGNRILQPMISTHQSLLNRQQSTFDNRNKALFGENNYDPWENPQNWVPEADGTHVAFPVWKYIPVKTIDPKTSQESYTYQPAFQKKVVMKTDDRDAMQQKYKDLYKPFGETATNPPPVSSDAKQNDATLARRAAAQPNADVNGINARFKSKYGVDLNSIGSDQPGPALNDAAP